MIDRIAGMRKRRNQGGFTLIELLVVIVILGVLSAVVVFAVRGVGDKGQAAAFATDAKTVRTAQELYCARFGTYGTEDQLVAQKFLSEPSVDTDVSLGSGGACGTGASSSFSLTTSAATVNVAANADQWYTSDTGSGPGYDSSAFSYPLNSNLYDPLLIMNSDYTISGGLAASWERIPVAADRATFTSALTPVALPLPTRAYAGDAPYPADTWRFHLRTGVTFQDGQAFNADDVIWTWRDRQALSGSQSSGANTLSYTMRLGGTAPAQYDSVEKIDAFTVDITPTTQNLRFPEQVLHPKGAIAQVRRDGSGNPLPAGFGAVTGLSSPRTIGRHLDGSIDGLPSGTGTYLGITRPASTTTNLSPTVTGANFVAADVGRTVIGTGVPAGASITAVNPGVSAALSANATASGTVTLTLAASTPAPSPAAPTLSTGTPQGTGPFKYVSYNPTNPQGGGTAKFQAYQNYWGSPKAQVQGMNYTFIADPAVRTAGLQSGQYDMAIDLNPPDVATVEGSGRRVVKAPYGRNSLIYVNKVVKTSPAVLDLTKVPPATPPNYTFNIGTDLEVRKAASLAIDRDAYVAAIYAGNAQAGRWMSPPGILGTYQNLVPPLSTNAASARTTLDADGWTCANGAPGAGTPCAVNEIRKWNGNARFTIGRQLDLYMIGISLVPQTGYDLLSAQMKLVGINLIAQRGTCDSAIVCPDGSVGRGQMYNTSMWDFDLELPNQNDANPAFLPVLRQACVNQSTTFRFAPADGTNGVGASVADTAANGGGTYPFGKTPCTSAGFVLGPMDTTWVPQSLTAATPAPNQEAAANMMAILVNQSATNVVIPVIGEYRIYGMSSKVNLGDPHPSQTSQRWVSLTMLF